MGVATRARCICKKLLLLLDMMGKAMWWWWRWQDVVEAENKAVHDAALSELQVEVTVDCLKIGERWRRIEQTFSRCTSVP